MPDIKKGKENLMQYAKDNNLPEEILVVLKKDLSNARSLSDLNQIEILLEQIVSNMTE